MTEQEHQPLKGQRALAKMAEVLAKKATGTESSGQAPETGKVDWSKEANEADARFRFQQSMKAMAGSEAVEKLRLDREAELAAEHRATAEHAQKLEDEKNQRLKDEKEAAETKAQDEAAERRRLEEEKRAAERDEQQRKQTEMEQKYQEAMKANSMGGFLENYRQWKALQQELGVEEKTPVSDPTIAIELKKLELQQAKEDREFKWRMRQDEKRFQIEMQQFQDEREYRREQMKQQEKKDEAFINTPKMIASVIAKGYLDGMSAQENEGISSSGPSGRQHYNLTIHEDAAGEIKCPNCQSPVPIGPTSKKAVCVKCHSTFSLARQPQESVAPETEEE